MCTIKFAWFHSESGLNPTATENETSFEKVADARPLMDWLNCNRSLKFGHNSNTTPIRYLAPCSRYINQTQKKGRRMERTCSTICKKGWISDWIMERKKFVYLPQLQLELAIA